jgi:hypothetical protein|eukprot:jgi/Chrpa1/3552/Chrysochromulina_OHIO_Genome00014206-RA
MEVFPATPTFFETPAYPGSHLVPPVPASPSTAAAAAAVDPTTTIVPLEAARLVVPTTEPSMNDDLAMGDESDDVEDLEDDHDDRDELAVMAARRLVLPLPQQPPGAGVQLSPRLQRRAQAQPMRLDTTVPVCCYRYAQGRPALEAADERWQGRTAYLHYFLPENWSPSYKFTVFEDSYVLSFACGAGEPWPPTCYHLARPLHGARPPSGGAQRPEFELVWPMELDRSLLEMVDAACDRVMPGVKRKPSGLAQPLSMHSVHLKLQRLEM